MSHDENPRDKKLRFIKAGAEAELVERSVYVPRNGFLWFSWLKFYTVRGEKERERERERGRWKGVDWLNFSVWRRTIG